MLIAIACIGESTRVIGKDDGSLIWRIPDDLKHFKSVTVGHPIIMGRKTFRSIGQALPSRTNIVVTRNSDAYTENVVYTNTLEKAIEIAGRAEGKDHIFIIGGGTIYKQALPLVDELWLTLVEDTHFVCDDACVYFPEYENHFTEQTRSESHDYNDTGYCFAQYKKN